MKLIVSNAVSKATGVQNVPTVTGPNTLGWFSRHLGFSSEASNMRGVLFGTLSNLYFQQNTSPYISHDTGTIMTSNDTGGI
jgi:hypothetical protein